MKFLRRGQKDKGRQEQSVVEAIVRKKSENTKYGIVFYRSNPNFPTSIESIRPKSLFHRTGLMPGMYLLEVNGKEATWTSPNDSARLLKNAPVGSELSIKAAIPKTINVTKDKHETSWGFSIKNSTKREGIFVDNVAPESIMACSGLEHGMMILKINGKTFANELKEAAKALRENGNSVEITVVQLESAMDVDLDDCTAITDIPEADDIIEESAQNQRNKAAKAQKSVGGNESDYQPQESIETGLEEYILHLQSLYDNVVTDKPSFGDFVKSNRRKQKVSLSDNRDDVNIASVNRAPQASQPREAMEEIDMDDFSYAESKSENKSSCQDGENRSSGWFFKTKEEECYDLDDQFPEKYTKSNNSVFLSVLPMSQKQYTASEVMSQVMQLRKLRQPVPKNLTVMTPEEPMANFGTEETRIDVRQKTKLPWLPSGRGPKLTSPTPEDELLNRRAILFGLKKEAAVPTVQRFDPKGRRPRFFPSPFSVKSRSKGSKLVAKTNTNTNAPMSVQGLFDMLLSFQDTMCTSLVSYSAPPEVSTTVATDTKSKPSVVLSKQKAREQEHVLEL